MHSPFSWILLAMGWNIFRVLAGCNPTLLVLPTPWPHSCTCTALCCAVSMVQTREIYSKRSAPHLCMAFSPARSCSNLPFSTTIFGFWDIAMLKLLVTQASTPTHFSLVFLTVCTISIWHLIGICWQLCCNRSAEAGEISEERRETS